MCQVSQKTDQSQENDSTIQGNEGEPVREVNSSQNRTSESVSEDCDSAESDTESNDTGDEASDHEEMTDESEDDNCGLVTITKRRISTKKPSKSGKIQIQCKLDRRKRPAGLAPKVCKRQNKTLVQVL